MRAAAIPLLFLSLAALACGRKEEQMLEPVARTPEPLPVAVRLGPDLAGVEEVSILQLLAAPTSFKQKPIWVVGYLDSPTNTCIDCSTFSLLCLHKEDAENRLFANCLSVDLGGPPWINPWAHRYVRIQGVAYIERFQKSAHLSIKDVRFLAPVPNWEQWAAGIGVQ